ncbi:hypothetical protein ACFX2K_035848 [Malus domestica]
MLQGIIFTCLIYSSGRCGSLFGSTAAVGDESSRAVLGRQSGKGSKQSVRTRTKERTRGTHDMRYSCFLPW